MAFIKGNFILFGLIIVCLPNDLLAQCGACQYSTNAVVNGNFTDGNVGFSSSLNYVTGIFTCPLCPENTYTVGANAILYHSDFFGFDHTNPPSGEFLICNGQGQDSSIVWCQTLEVTPNTAYNFSYWARDLTNNPDPHPLAMLQTTWNGIYLNDTLIAEGGWTNFSTTWNSGAETSLQLCIVNLQSQTGGNDFGLDDIALTTCNEYHLSQIANAGADQELCSNAVVQIGAAPNPGYSYSWNNSNGLSNTQLANPTLTLANSTSATIQEMYILTTDSAGVGCVQRDTMFATVLPVPVLSLGNDTTICPGSIVQLTVSEIWNSVQWSNGQTASTIETAADTIEVTVTFENCSVSDQIFIYEESLPDISLGDDTSFCASSSLILHTSANGLWSDGSYADSLLVTSGGLYSFTYIQNDCSVADSVFVTAYQLPETNLPTDTAFCEGAINMLGIAEVGLWSDGSISDSIMVNSTGLYFVSVTNGPCTSMDSTFVQMDFLPSVDLGNTLSACEDEELTITAEGENIETYNWNTTDTTKQIHIHKPGIYFVTVSNRCGSAEDSVVVEVYPCNYGLHIPNAFTVNDDDINEGWAVQGYNVTNVSVNIYNRVGNLIFHADGLNQSWKPGAGIGDDIYNFRVEAVGYDGSLIEEHGVIYLLR